MKQFLKKEDLLLEQFYCFKENQLAEMDSKYLFKAVFSWKE